MSKSVRYGAIIALAGVLCATGAQAQEMSDEDYIKSRIAHYRELGTWFKAITDQMKSDKPRPSTIRTAALGINRLAKAQYGWFRPGSGPESEEKTKAKPVIWAKSKEFKAAQDRLLAESTAFLTAANSASDPKTLAPRVKALGQACASCHETFRTE